MQLEQVHIEYRAGLFLAVIALVLSLATGFIAGIPFLTVLLRGCVFAAVFFGVGFAAFLVLKKLVPEVYQALASPEFFSSEKQEAGEQEFGEEPEMEMPGGYSPDESAETGGFTELTEKDFDRYNTPADSGLGTSLNPSQGKMGKHILVQQQFNAYEPKIMAQAIKTMMSKDKE